PELVAELVALPVDIIVAPSTATVIAARAATSVIPIVSMGRGGDLVEFGLADSLARPGGNVTGLTNLTDRLHGKRLQLLTEAVPRAALVAVLWDGNLPVPFPRRAFEEPAGALGIQLIILELQSPKELDAAFEMAVRERADAAYV